MKKLSLLLFLSLFFTLSLYADAKPRAEWRMDACVWEGVSGEVRDSSGNGYAGTAHETPTAADGAICRGGDFTHDGTEDYLSLDSGALDGLSDLTVTVWFKTDHRGPQPLLSGANGKQYNELIVWFPDSRHFRPFVKGKKETIDLSKDVADGKWHFAAMTREGGKVCFYLDGSLEGCAEGLPEGALKIDAGGLIVGQEQDALGGGFDAGQNYIGYEDELKIFDRVLDESDIGKIYDNESKKRNFDGSERTCETCVFPPEAKEGEFNAVDYKPVCDAVANWNDAISTKIAGEGYPLMILSKEYGTDTPMEANITRVELRYYEEGERNRCKGSPYRTTVLCADGCGETDAQGCLVLTVPSALNGRAAKCVEVFIEGRDAAADKAEDLNSSLSADDFSVRPDRFLFLRPLADSNLTSEHDYAFASAVRAVPRGGSGGVPDFNTTVAMQSRKYMRNGEANGSMAGSLSETLSAFSDGMADLRLSFDDVGIVTLEINDTSWCAVDADDTPEINRTVYGERNVTFIPHHFKMAFIASPRMEDNDTAGGFTYLSNDLRMSAWLRNLSLKVTAEGEKGGTMKNFSDPMNRLFADPVDITPLLKLPAKHSPARTLGEPQPKTGVDLGFASGEAVLSYSDVAFNYDRTYDEPLDPFHVAGNEGNFTVTLQDTAYPSVAGGVRSDFSGGATFCFGRLRAVDVATTERSVDNVVEIEVYAETPSSFVSGFRQNSLHWYRNEKQRSGMNGRIKEANATVDVTLSSPSDTGILMDFSRYGNGTVTMEINTTVDVPRKRIIHLDIDSWLWYVPKGFGSPYAYDGASDCTKHPCFGYTYIGKGRTGGVQSGEINGSDFDAGSLENNATYLRRQGVKIFR